MKIRKTKLYKNGPKFENLVNYIDFSTTRNYCMDD